MTSSLVFPELISLFSSYHVSIKLSDNICLRLALIGF